MATPLATKRLTRELHALTKNPLTSPRITATPHESNILEWHYVLEGPSPCPSSPTHDPSSPYTGGIYHGKLIFPREYPYKPPSVIMLTPNGRFKTNRRLCLSMSDFHPETWNPMWSISTILTGLYSFMMETSPTLGSVETTDAVKRQLARDSLGYNVEVCGEKKVFRGLFPQYVELWEQRERERKEKEEEERQRRAAAGESEGNAGGSEGRTEVVVPSEGGAGAGMWAAFFEENAGVALGAGAVALFSILVALLRFF
ncbi:hypothetical protein ACHAXS_003269 [Conticribra weissflogii]